jgi:hypothetical protein
MIHRISAASMEEFEAVESGAFRYLLVDDDPQYTKGHELYLLYVENGKLKYLLRRRIINVQRDKPSLPADCCALELF